MSPSGSRAWRTCLLVAALFLVGGAYLLVAPLERVSDTGVPFDCGSAVQPAGGDFARNVCGDLNARRQLQAGTVGVGAVVLAGGGWLAYGRRRRDDRTVDAEPAEHTEHTEPGRPAAED